MSILAFGILDVRILQPMSLVYLFAALYAFVQEHHSTNLVPKQQSAKAWATKLQTCFQELEHYKVLIKQTTIGISFGALESFTKINNNYKFASRNCFLTSTTLQNTSTSKSWTITKFVQ
jgi:seryl-tRNA(Sec) selenium transferase